VKKKRKERRKKKEKWEQDDKGFEINESNNDEKREKPP
jgi:hypothetical protein